jgi:hypothetical protein
MSGWRLCGETRPQPHSSKPVFPHGRVEIEQESNRQAAQLHVSEHLCFMDGLKSFDRLQLCDHPDFDDNIQPITAIQSHGLVNDRKRNLPFERDARGRELEAKTFFVSGFEQSRAELAMDFYGQANDLLGEKVIFRRMYRLGPLITSLLNSVVAERSEMFAGIAANPKRETNRDRFVGSLSTRTMPALL